MITPLHCSYGLIGYSVSVFGILDISLQSPMTGKWELLKINITSNINANMDYNNVIEVVKNASGTYDVISASGHERRRLFVSTSGRLCEFAPRSRTKGFPIATDVVARWISVDRVVSKETNLVAKFRKYAQRASFTSPLVRMSLAADTLKSCYENGLTTGTRIDGDIISLDAIEKWCPWSVSKFRDALRERRDYHSGSFDFRGYDGSLWLTVVTEDDNFYRKGDVVGGFSKEFRGCANGYYYSLINDEHFIGIDID